MGNMSLSRRRLLTGASATAALGALGSASVVQAKAPPLNTPAPAFYRFKLGSLEVTPARVLRATSSLACIASALSQ